VIRYRFPRGASIPTYSFANPSPVKTHIVAAGQTVRFPLDIPAGFLPAGKILLGVQLVDSRGVVVESPLQSVEVGSASPAGNIPPPGMVETLFRYQPRADLAAEAVQSTEWERHANLTWGQTYQNPDTSPYHVHILLFAKGAFLNAELKRRVDGWIKKSQHTASFPWPNGEKTPVFKFKTADGRVGYNYLEAGLGGTREYTALPTRDGKNDLLVVVDFDPDIARNLSNPAKPARTGHDVIEQVEALLNGKPILAHPSGEGKR